MEVSAADEEEAKEMEMADIDGEMKALDEDSTRDYEAGEEVVSGGKPTAAPKQLGPISKDLRAVTSPLLTFPSRTSRKHMSSLRLSSWRN